MANDIKSLLDNIIDDTDKSFPSSDAQIGDSVGNRPLTFDRGGFREKLALGVLKDMVSAMMAHQWPYPRGCLSAKYYQLQRPQRLWQSL